MSSKIIRLKKAKDNAILPSACLMLAIGRMNYLFCGDDEAAQRAAVIYHLLATCKARGIDEGS